MYVGSIKDIHAIARADPNDAPIILIKRENSTI